MKTLRVDVAVIGGGMAGTVAAIAAARAGADVALIDRGLGATALSSGIFDIVSPGPLISRETISPRQRIEDVVLSNAHHPYTIASAGDTDKAIELIASALSLLSRKKVSDPGYAVPASFDSFNAYLTNLGTVKWGAFAFGESARYPLSDFRNARAMVVGFEQLSDFDPRAVCLALGRLDDCGLGGRVAESDWLTVEVPRLKSQMLESPTLAGLLDAADEILEQLLKIVKGKLIRKNFDLLIFPPAMGVRRNSEIMRRCEDVLGVRCQEPFSSTPSVHGLRLQHFLHRLLLCSEDIKLLVGEVSACKSSNGIVKLILVADEREVEVSAVVLCTGKYVGGGVASGVGAPAGTFNVAVFDLPVFVGSRRMSETFVGDLFGRRLCGPHELYECGLRVDSEMRPLGEDGATVFKNLFAAGAVIGGVDAYGGGCGLGVAATTGRVAGLSAARYASTADEPHSRISEEGRNHQ